MATNAVEEDVEYESDPEEAKRSLTMRRREASDDEEGESEATDNKREEDLRVHSDDSDGEGGVAEYDDDEELEEEEEEELEEEEEEELDEEEVYGERGVEEEEGERGEGGAEGSVVVVKESDGDVRPHLEDSGEVNSDEKKENEPFAVPTAGAFYMHDDRFRDNARGRHRRTRGGRRLWESKDDRKWGHDKFEELTLQERHYQEGRRPSKGNYRGRAKNRGSDRGGYVRGNRKGYDGNSGNQRYNGNNSDQSQVPKAVVRGRGPRRYEPSNKSNGPSSKVQNKQFGEPLEKTSNGSSERTSAPTSKSQPDPVPAKKQVIASNLNYASPPFYPSGSSNKEINLTQKRDVQSGSTSRNEGFSVQQNNALLRGKNVVDPTSMDKLYIDGSIGPSVGKPLNNAHMALPGSSVVNASQSPHPRAAGRVLPTPVQMNYQPATSYNQVNKVSPTQLQASQRSSAPGRSSASVQATAPQLGHRSGSGSQSSSPPKASTSIKSFDSGEIDAVSESGKSKVALVGKGRGGSQGSGRGSVVYGGAQVMGASGNVGAGHGDPNFPAFLPVMQFGGQHPGGMGVPAVGMAFPGYVGQPHGGIGNSEMTWLPVLAGAAGALGATYCSPYLAIDGAYPRQSGQASAMGNSSKENNKANNELKPPQRSEVLSEEVGQRQNKPRRYSEMDFGQ